MERNLRNQTIALAGIIQAGWLVRQVANRGVADSEPLETSLRSLFATDPDTIEDIYGGLEGLRSGLRQLVSQLGGSSSERPLELTRYVITLLHLERKLMGRPAMLATISDDLERARRQSQHFGLLHDNVLSNLADTYSATISTLNPRIMVHGEPSILANPDNAKRIRALLLAGIRSAVLWRQAGGSRLRLLLQRRALVGEAEALLRGL